MALRAFVYAVVTCLSRDGGICKTPQCIATANMLKMGMTNISPEFKTNACIDLHGYVCGNFVNTFPRPPSRNSVNMVDYGDLIITRKLAEMLGRPNSENDSVSLRRVRLRYQQLTRGNQDPASVRQGVASVKSSYPRAVAYLLVHGLNGYEARRKVENLLNNVKESFKKKIRTSWMHDAAKAEAIKKIESVRSQIFFTDDMINSQMLDQTDSARWFRFLDNKFEYRPSEHTIGVPIAALTIPYYNYGIESMDYGGIVQTLAHELGHMFDHNTKYMDSNNQRTGWWTQRMDELYNERAEPFIGQYSQITVNGINVDGRRTLSENIQDNVGFEIALDAWRSNATRQKKLIHFEEFTPEQLFTLAFAIKQCENLSSWYLQNKINNDRHAPALARINGVAMNSREFSSIWSCPAGSPMNPPKKNDVWV